MDGLYGFMKGGKEYYYVPAEFGGYGVMGTESGQYGRDLAVNLNLRNKDVVAAGKATKLDPDSVSLLKDDNFFSNLKDPDRKSTRLNSSH